LGLSLEEFQASALANLRHRLRPQASPITLAKYRVEAVQADRNNESGVLLLDDYWEAVKKKCQGDILAIVPARDILLYAGGAEAWAIQALQLIAEKAEASCPYGISRLVLRRAGASWVQVQ